MHTNNDFIVKVQAKYHIVEAIAFGELVNSIKDLGYREVRRKDKKIWFDSDSPTFWESVVKWAKRKGAKLHNKIEHVRPNELHFSDGLELVQQGLKGTGLLVISPKGHI